MKFNDKELESLVKQEILQALHDENVRLGLYDGVYAIDILEQENRLLRARNDRLEKELAMYQVQRLGQEIQPEQEPVAWMHNSIRGNVIAHRPADIDRNPDRWIALYTTPPPQHALMAEHWKDEYDKLKAACKPLTDDEIDQGLLRTNYAMHTAGAWRDGVEWATKQLKEKNT